MISSMGAANKMDPSRFQVADISQTRMDPIARVIRTKLRKEGITKGVKVVFSDEEPMKPREEITKKLYLQTHLKSGRRSSRLQAMHLYLR